MANLDKPSMHRAVRRLANTLTFVIRLTLAPALLLMFGAFGLGAVAIGLTP